MTNSTAYLLVSHGSRDHRPQIAMSNLAKIISEKLRQENESDSLATFTKKIIVETASLELANIPLHQQIIKFAQSVLNLGITKINVIPLFLLAGVHVRQDLPLEIDLAKKDLDTKIELNLSNYLGSNLNIIKLLKAEFERLDCTRKIILAHGSRRQESNRIIEEMAGNLSALAAYWSVAPDLESQLVKLINQEMGKVAIVPYFLFPGGITEAIAQQIEILQQKYPQIELKFGNTLDKNSLLIELIIELLSE